MNRKKIILRPSNLPYDPATINKNGPTPQSKYVLIRIIILILPVIEAVIVVRVTLAVLQIDLCEHEARQFHIKFGQLLEAFADHFARRRGPAREIDSRIDH